MKRQIGVIILCAAVFIPCPVFAKAAAYDLGEHTPLNASLRSLILPGWGQYFNDEQVKGYIIGGVALAAAAAAYIFDSQANATYDEYETIGAREGDLYSEYETQANQASVASLVAAGAWIYAVADAYLVARGSNDAACRKKEGFSVANNAGRSTITYSRRF